MESDPEDSDEDPREDAGPTVLWERRIQQSIVVDLSEDESLHFSDLEGSFALRLSRAESEASEPSVHLTGSAELSSLDDSSSKSGGVGSRSEKAQESNAGSCTPRVSAQRPDRGGPKRTSEDPGGNTSDEDQEDLPYDGDLGSPYFFNRTSSSSEGRSGSDGRRTVRASPELSDAQGESIFEASKSREAALPPSGPPDIRQVLLRHFSQEELLRSGWQIEKETLPEVSLLESVDETVRSASEKRNVSSSLEEEPETEVDNRTAAAADDATSGGASEESKRSCGDVGPAQQEGAEERDELQRVPLLRARSFGEMKYGQGQVHYPLPDFSKVAPKVKIPKASARAAPQSPGGIHRAQSSPGMLELVSRVMEESGQPPERPYVFKDEGKRKPPALVHHLQAEYDKLLTKYAEAENLIDQMRLEANVHVSSDLKLHLEQDDADQAELKEEEEEQGTHGRPPPRTLPSENLLDKREKTTLVSAGTEATAVRSSRDEDPSDGDRMTSELRDIVGHFMQKVEEFKLSVSSVAMSTEDQQLMMRSMMEAQDQLERNYISKKEEHRALEMQNYMGLRRNTGTFDPNRLVEGDIFRIGMHLDDIKEMIDKNVCEQFSPPHSTSTPTEMTPPLQVELGPLCTDSASPPPSLHEFSVAEFSIESFNEDSHREAENEDLKEDSEFIEDDGFDQNIDSPLTNTQQDIRQSWGARSFSEGSGLRTGQAEEGNDGEERSSASHEVRDGGDITAHLSGGRSTPGDSRHAVDGAFSPPGPSDAGDGVSLAVEVSRSSDAARESDSGSVSEPPLNSSPASQRIVSPETDSGFGSSYLNQSSSGPFQPNVHTESTPSHNEGLSSSDSDGSCANLQTAIHSASLSGHQWSGCDPSAPTRGRGAAAVELWVENTTKAQSVRLQGSDHHQAAPLLHHINPPVVTASMETEGRGSPLHSCPCNSEAILALQSEVSRLKKELEDGLVQLPHLAQKMDYLTSRYRREHHSRRSRTRSHPKTPSDSAEKSTGRGLSNLSPCTMRIEDWISTDMDHSKSKGTDNGDTSCSEMTMSLHSSTVGGRRVEFETQRQAEKPNTADAMSRFYSKERWAPLVAPCPQKPLLQVSYSSSCSLPASYKVREPPPPQSASHHRKRSTQSDSALLPSNVYFQRTPSPGSGASNPYSKRRGSKEEDMSRTLDQAIEVARCMKRTTDRMARRLSADLAKAQLHRKPRSTHPPGGSKQQALR